MTLRSRRPWFIEPSEIGRPAYSSTTACREGEFESTLALLKQSARLNIRGVDATERFLGAGGVVDPEKKRKIIGAAFIDVFEKKRIESAMLSSRSRHALSGRH